MIRGRSTTPAGKIVVWLNSFTLNVDPVSIEPLVIACAADRQYAMPLAVMLRSTVANLDPQRELNIYIVDGGLDREMRARICASLPRQVTLHWIAPARGGFVDLPLWGRMTITTYDKLTLGRWLPASVKRAIWLDCDLMVLGDLARLWAIANENHCVLAVQDVLVRTMGARFGVASYREMGIPDGAEYFNAGVMLIDVARWRTDDIAGRALAYLRNNRRVFFWDQEALNAVLAGEWGKLDPRWNWNPNFETSPETSLETSPRGSPWIIHFAGGLKPWHFEGRSTSHKRYYQYLDATAWAGWRPAHNWRTAMLSHYESSRFRRALFPLECLRMGVERAMTMRYVSADSGEQPAS